MFFPYISVVLSRKNNNQYSEKLKLFYPKITSCYDIDNLVMTHG